MKHFFFLFSFLFFSLQADVTICPYHKEEIQHIRYIATDSICEAHQLTGDIIGSLFITTRDLAWDAVKKNVTYSDFSKTFQAMIEHCNKKGKYLASNRLYNGLGDVGDLYLKLYNNCISTHHNFQSVFERGKIHFDKGHIEECLVDMNSLINVDLVNDLLKVISPLDLLITRGASFSRNGKL